MFFMVAQSGLPITRSVWKMPREEILSGTITWLRKLGPERTIESKNHI